MHLHLTFLQGIPLILAPTNQCKNHSSQVLSPGLIFVPFSLVPVPTFQKYLRVSNNRGEVPKLATQKGKVLVRSGRSMPHLHGKRKIQLKHL